MNTHNDKENKQDGNSRLMELRFQSPDKLNSTDEPVPNSDKHPWFHSTCKAKETKAPLMLDFTNWSVICSQCEARAEISKWQADESSYFMKMDTEEATGIFTEVDYTFSVSMIGQMVSSDVLLRYLKALQQIYSVTKE